MLCEPLVENVVVNEAVPPAKLVCPALIGVTATGAPIGVPLLEKVTVPVAPVMLMLWEEIAADKVTCVLVVTPVFGLAASPVMVVARVTLTASIATEAL